LPRKADRIHRTQNLLSPVQRQLRDHRRSDDDDVLRKRCGIGRYEDCLRRHIDRYPIYRFCRIWIWQRRFQKKSAASNRGSATATSRQDNRNANDQEYDIHFYITDAADLPMMDWPYCIETASGKRVEGRTDNQGKTIRIASALAECARLHVYEQDVTPIDANWDRQDESEAHR
jgi:hypothetical protein